MSSCSGLIAGNVVLMYKIMDMPTWGEFFFKQSCGFPMLIDIQVSYSFTAERQYPASLR